MSDFIRDIEHVINCYSKDNEANTPDFILAQFLASCLAAYTTATRANEMWHGRGDQLLSTPPGGDEDWFAKPAQVPPKFKP